MNKKSVYIFFGLLAIIVLCTDVMYGQCAMCKAVAETEQEGDNATQMSKGLNSGILYLMSVPYIMGGIAFYWFYKQYKKNKGAQLA